MAGSDSTASTFYISLCFFMALHRQSGSWLFLQAYLSNDIMFFYFSIIIFTLTIHHYLIQGTYIMILLHLYIINQTNSIMTNPTVYLRTGDFITISHEGLFLGIESLTQSLPAMRESISNSSNAVFLLTTQKCLERSLDEGKPLVSYNEDHIYYSQPVLLFHLLSGKFLSYNKDIENKASVELVTSFKDNCKFSIKPIFKCQTVTTRKIRNQETVVICPAEAYNHEGNIALVVLRNDSRKGDQSFVLMKKNQSSKFQLARKNDPAVPQNSISNIYIYQLLNIQTKKNLYMSLSQTKHKDLITFEKSINQFASYFDFRIKENNKQSEFQHFEYIGVTQKQLKYGMVFYIHSWKQNKYLSFNVIGDACLTEIANQDAQFTLESYSDSSLNKDSVVRIRHVASQKYLSLNAQATEAQIIHEMRLIDTFMIVRVPIEELRLNVFINDTHEIIQQELAEKKLNYSNRESIFRVLKELINFIYGDQITIQDFLSMKNKISCKLSSNDQKLLANIGIINTLVRMCRTFIEQITREQQIKEFEQRDNTDEQIIIIYTMMSIVGICTRNAASTRILVQEMPLLYESLVSVSGIIQSFYNLFKDSKELLLILENTSHKIGRKDVPSMQVLINMLAGHNLDILTKCKILKLLEVFIIVNHKEKILGHEAILLRSLQEGKLDNVMLPMTSNDSEDLFINVGQKTSKKPWEELEELLTARKTYEKQLQLVKIQLQLLCSLCLNSNTQCFSYATKIITEQMLFRYLKANLQPDFKQIFMRILIDIYLSNLAYRNSSLSKCFIISSKNVDRTRTFSKITESSVRDQLISQEGEEMSDIAYVAPSHSKIIENIQNHILEVTKKSIINQIIDSSFYMNLKSLRKFLDLRILDKEQVVEFRLLLIQYIAKFSKVSFKEEQKKKIVLEIIKIMTDYFNQHLEAISEAFVLMLRDQKIPQDKLFGRFLLFINQYEFFNAEVQQQELKFLPKLIKESIQFNSNQIFIAASTLFKIINQRSSVFFSRLKQKIIIDSDWTYKFYNKSLKLKRTLSTQIQAFMSSKSDQKQIQYIEQQLNQLVKQLNFSFFENVGNSSQFSQLAQNVYRELGVLEMIVGFLNESQDKFKEGIKGNVDIYSTCFQFIGLYLQDNRQNFYRFQDKYIDIKFVFEHPDRGQIKFLNQLIKMPNARDLMMDQIIECIILSFEHNTEPNPYTLLALINAISNPHIDKERIEILVEKLIRSPKTFQAILKIVELKAGVYFFSWSYDPENKSYHRNWLIYAYLMVKFLLILLEQSSERTSLALEIQKYVNINSLMDLLKAQDLLLNTSMSSLEGTLLKNQIIKLFIRIYLPLLQKQQNQIQNICSFVHLTLNNLSFVKEDHQGANAQLSEQINQKTSQHGSIIFEAELKVKTKLTLKEFQKYFNPIYVSLVQYFPFIIKLLDKMLNSNAYVQGNLAKKSQIGLYMDNVYRKMRDFVQYKLPYKEFSNYSKEYQSAISNCEDLFKKKLGFNLDIQQNQEDQDAGEVQINDYFINTKIENTVKCYKSASNENQKKIYEALIYMFHAQSFRGYLRKDEQNFPIIFSFQQMQKIKTMMLKYVNLNHQKFSQTVRLFFFFTKFNKEHCLKMNFGLIRQQLMGYLLNEKQDLGNQKLCSYLAVTSEIFRQQIEKQTIIPKKNQVYSPFKQAFLARIYKRIQLQKQLNNSNKINEQAIIYTQNGLLTYQQIPSSLTIELCLEWIRNMIIITPFKLKEKLYSELFMQVVDLLKGYTVFVREFNCKYVSYEVYGKINLCLEVIFHFVSGITTKSVLINYLIERQIWNDLNLILGLDDGWSRNLDELEDTQLQIFAKVTRNQLRTSSRIFLKQAEKLYSNSKKNYKLLIPEQYYPLIPMKSLFSSSKSNVISILKQFKHLPLQIQKQLFSRIDLAIINRNILEIYRKHHRLYNEYDIPSVEVDINFGDGSQWRAVADNIGVENGVDLTSIRMHVTTISGNYQLKTQYNNLRLEAMNSKKITSAFSSFFTFIKEFFLLFLSCFLNLCRKKKNTYRKEQQEIDQKKMLPILNFFLTKTGRVEATFQGELLSKDFFIRPQCNLNKEIKQKFIEKINFLSMQLKLESIYNQARVFLLYFQNQIDFFRTFNKFAYLTFLTRNVEMLIYLNFAVIVAQNLVLIINSDSKDEYFTTNSLNQPFVWLQIASTIIAGSVMVAYCVKDLHLLIKNINMTLKIRAESYGSNYNNYNSLVKLGIKLSMVCLNPTFAYHLFYTFIVCLVFYNKLFAALLMLDIFFQIPTLKNLMMSVWRPKVELVLAIVSFVLLQYFFSIFMFFNFKKQTLGFCQTLGSCFGFVFVTTYKAVGGFVGYLFIKNGSQIQPVNFFQIFQDIYVVLIFQIFFALILAIIIDAFSLIRSQQTVRKDYLNGCCIVCNLDKTRFNSSTMSFKAHIAITHNIWNYFYYYEYIFHKPALKRTAYEREIFLTKSAIWLPMDASFDVVEEGRMVPIMEGEERAKIKNE